MAKLLSGKEVCESLNANLIERSAALQAKGVTPTLAIIRVGEDKAVLMDVDGNRFVIESISLLDRKSYRNIELYL